MHSKDKCLGYKTHSSPDKHIWIKGKNKALYQPSDQVPPPARSTRPVTRPRSPLPLYFCKCHKWKRDTPFLPKEGSENQHGLPTRKSRGTKAHLKS